MQRSNIANVNFQYLLILSGVILAGLIGYFIGFNGVSKLFIAGILGAVFLILTVIRPWVAVSAFFALIPLENLFVFEGSITSTMTKLVGAYLVVLVIITGSLRYIHDVFSSKKVLAMMLFGGAATLSIMLSDDMSFSLPFLISLWLSIILCFVLVMMIRDTKTLNIAIWALLIGGVISVISPVFFRFGRVAGYDLLRYGGLWGDQNEFAAVLLVLIPLSVVNIITSRRNIYKFISVAISATLITGVILTYSRGGFLALCLMVVLAIFKLTSGNKRLKILAISVPCMIVAFALAYYFFSEDIIARMETLKFLSSKEAVAKDASLQLRYYFYFELTPKAFSEHPIFGLGLRQILAYNPYHYVTHNTFFEVLTGTGLLGFIPFILILFLSWKELRTVEKAESGNDNYLRYCASALELGFLAYLFAGLFISLDLNKMLWLTISMTAVVFNLYRINTGNSPKSVNRSRNRDHYNDRRLTYPNRV